MSGTMQKKLAIILCLLMLTLPFLSAKPAGAQATLETVFIRPDGCVDPASAPIQQSDNTYTLTGNLNAAIRILKSNVILDGAGYTLSGPYDGGQSDIAFIGSGTDQLPTSTQGYTIGIDLGNKSLDGIVIKNFNIRNFSIGMYIWTKNNTVVGNAISNCVIGVLLSGINETVIENLVFDHQIGLFFGFNNPGSGESIPPDIIIYKNSFERNQVQLSGCQCATPDLTEPIHNWDNEGRGNYWSDYNGTDADSDGVGDTPYMIDVLNQDRYPLMVSPVSPPTVSPPHASPTMETALFIIAFIAVAAVVFVIFRLLTRRSGR
jgi:hypothetical protein